MIPGITRAVTRVLHLLAPDTPGQMVSVGSEDITAYSEEAAARQSQETLHSSNTARQLGTQALYVLFGNIFTLAVGLPLQIYVARVIGTAGLGVYGLIDGAVSTASGFLAFGVAPTMVRYIPAHLERGEYGAVRRLVRLGALVLACAGGIAYVALLIALPRVGEFWPELAAYSHIVASMGLLLPLGLFMFFLQSALRGFREIRYMVLGSSFLQLTVKAAATVGAFAAGWRLQGYVLAVVLASLVGVLWMAWGLKRKLDQLPEAGTEPAATPLHEWRRYATVCYSYGLLGAASTRLDRFILGASVDASAVGVLLVVNQLQQLPQIFLQMLLMVGAPMFAAAHSRNAASERQHIYALITDWEVKASLPLILFFLLFAHPVLALFGPGFAERGTGVLQLLMLWMAIGLATGPIGNLAMLSGLEHRFLRISAMQAAIYAGLTIALTVPFGLFGVALAIVASGAFGNASTMIMVRRRLRFRWWNRRFLGWLAPAAASGGLGMAILYLGFRPGPVSLALTLIAMYVSFALVLYLQGLHDDERDLIRHIADRFITPQSK